MRRLGAILGLALALAVALPDRAAADSIDRIWDTGDEPLGIVIDPTDGRVYVANSKVAPWPAPSITVVDPSRAVGGVTQLMTSGAPALLALDPVHRKLYSSNQDRTLQVFDLTTMSLEATLPVGGLGVVVDPSTRRVYVVDYFAGAFSIVAVDGATNTIVQQTQSAPPGEDWFGLAIDRGLHRLYITNIETSVRNLIVLDDRDLSRVDAVTLPVVPRFALAVDEALNRVYVAGNDPRGLDGPSMLLELDGFTLATLSSIQVPGFPAGIALAPAIHRIFVTNSSDYASHSWGYSEIDDRTLELVRFHATPSMAILPAVHPNGRLYLGAWTSSVFDDLMGISLGNTPPVITGLMIVPSTPRTNEMLRADVSANDPDLPERQGGPGQAVALTYEWLRNGVVVAGQAGSTFDLSQLGDRGDLITVRVNASDGELSTTASASVVVANTPLTESTLTLSDATPASRDVLVASAQSDDADNDATYTYTWSVNGAIKRVASTVGTDSFDLREKGNGDNGDVVTVSVVASDGESTTSMVSASATVTPGRRQ
jgi:DNA-binding beta-propeller fold protein YncE